MCPQSQWKERVLTRRTREAAKPRLTLEPKSPYEYTATFTLNAAKKRRTVAFSHVELRHLLISIAIVVAVGVSMIMNPFGFSLYGLLGLTGTVAASMVFAAIFLAHELAHKIAAQRNGLWAEFRLIPMGAIVTVISIFSPLFKIISPGAVMIGGAYVDGKIMGKVAFAGPLTNLVLAPFFFAVAVAALPFDAVIFLVAAYGFLFNSMVTFLNLLPFGILDGYKIFHWNKVVWSVAFAFSIMLVVVAYLLV